MSLSFILATVALCFQLILIGGGLYELLVVDPFWPKRPDLIQPNRGGISRRRFWGLVHPIFEVSLIFTLVASWSVPAIRLWLWVAVIGHFLVRIWSFLDFIPKALAFERAEPGSVTEASARKWTHRSIFRLPLELVPLGAMIITFMRLARMR